MCSIISESDDKITLHHNHVLYTALLTEDKWSCDCPDHEDSTLPLERTNIMSHFKSHSLALEAEFGPHTEVPETLTENLITTSTLRSVGLAINTRARLLVCLDCERAVLPSHIDRHLKDHKYSLIPLERILRPFNLLDKYPAPSADPMPYIEGIALYDALACGHCAFAYSTAESLAVHHSRKHSGLPTTQSPSPVKAQQLTKMAGKDRRLVIVTAPASTAGHDCASLIDGLSSLMNRLNSTVASTQIPHDIRNVASWTRLVRWHEQVEPYDPATLITLVSMPDNGEFPLLHEAVKNLLKEACDYIPKTPALILQRLVSPYIAIEGISNTPFRKHQDHTHRMEQYCLPVVHLVSMLFRRTDAYPIVVPSNIEQLIIAARTAVESPDPAHLSFASVTIQYLLLGLWTTAWAPIEGSPVVDPTIHYLMLSALKSDGSFMEPKSFTNTIARLEYDMRAIFLKAAHEMENVSLTAAYHQMEPWLQEKQESTFNTLRRHQHLFTTVVYSTLSLPSIWWISKDYTSMIFKGSVIKLSHLTEIVTCLDDTMKRLWEEDILCGLGLRVTYDRLVDDLSNTCAGYSFMSDPRNRMFKDKTLLARSILLNANVSAKFVSFHCDDTLVWNSARMRQWLNAYSQLQLLHLVRALITGGSPSRGTEMTGMQLTNSSAGGTRNLVVFDHTLSLLCTYSKTSTVTGHDKLIPHGMDGFGSDLLIQDLAIARPFAELVVYSTNPSPAKLIALYRRHIFVNRDRLFTTDDISNMLKKLTTEIIGRPLGISDYRHFSTGFRRMLLSRMNALYEDDEKDSIPALQSGHTRATENRVYGLSADNLARTSEDLLPLFLEASMDWQRELRIVPGGLRLRYDEAMCCHFDGHVKAGRVSVLAKADDLRSHIQKCVELVVANAVERQTLELKGMLMDLLDGKSMRKSESMVTYESTPPSSQESSANPLELALGHLRGLLKNDRASWTSQGQCKAVEAALLREQDLVSVLPTGGGKSMIAIIPSLVQPDCVTILVIPLISLLDDYVQRLTLMDIAFDVYANAPISPGATLLLVSADVMNKDHLKQHLLILHNKKPVARIVFDEAHIPMNDCHYRHALREMYSVRKTVPAQFCLLSATIPPRAESELSKFYGLTDKCAFIRESTNRPELYYDWRAPESNVAAHAADVARAHVFEHERQRGLIFVPSYDLGHDIAGLLECEFYHSDTSVTRDDKKKIHLNWINGTSRFMVCTSAFGAGNDYQHTSIVIHAGTPFTMSAYTQEVSRGGRDHCRARCILLPSSATRGPPVCNDVDAAGAMDMYQALKNQGECIRKMITAFSDGNGTSCLSDPRNIPCIRCEGPPAPAQKRTFGTVFEPKDTAGSSSNVFEVASDHAKRRKIQETLTAENGAARALRAVTECKEICFLCSTRGQKQPKRYHDASECPTFKRNFKLPDFISFRGGIVYQGTRKDTERVCYFCHVPQGEFNSIHPQFSRD